MSLINSLFVVEDGDEGHVLRVFTRRSAAQQYARTRQYARMARQEDMGLWVYTVPLDRRTLNDALMGEEPEHKAISRDALDEVTLGREENGEGGHDYKAYLHRDTAVYHLGLGKHSEVFTAPLTRANREEARGLAEMDMDEDARSEGESQEHAEDQPNEGTEEGEKAQGEDPLFSFLFGGEQKSGKDDQGKQGSPTQSEESDPLNDLMKALMDAMFTEALIKSRKEREQASKPEPEASPQEKEAEEQKSPADALAEAYLLALSLSTLVNELQKDDTQAQAEALHPRRSRR